MPDSPIAAAQFDPAVKKYWLTYALLICLITGIGILFSPLIAIIVVVASGKILGAMSAELFERKLVVRRGIWFRVEKSIPLEKITDVGLTQGPLMRFFGLYRLDFETAGQSGTGALVSMLGIVDATAFRETILSQKDRLQLESGAAAQAQPQPEAGDAMAEQMSALVASVRNIEQMLAARDRD